MVAPTPIALRPATRSSYVQRAQGSGHVADWGERTPVAAQPDVGLLLHIFRVDQQRRALAVETIRVRHVVLMSFASFVHGELLHATIDQINAWLDSLALVARSRTKYISHLHAFYECMIRAGHTDTDPTVRIPRPKLPRLLPRPIDTVDLRTALEEAPPRIEAMLSLACYEGLRCFEIAVFSREWIWGQGEDQTVIIPGKGGHQRMVPLAAETEQALRRYDAPRRGCAFPSRFDRPYHPVSISNLLSKYLRGIGINATAHQLRHWFGTECYRQTRDLLETKELLGHSSVSTTQGYVALVPEESTSRMVRRLSAR